MDNRFSEIDRELESSIKSIGKKLFSRIQAETETFIHSKWWEAQVLEWCLRDDFLKTRILKFIDVFPSLKTPQQVIAHLREYFPESEHRLPIPLRLGVSASKIPFLTSRALSSIVNLSVTKIAKQFIAGSTAEEAFEAVKSLREENMSFTFDVLGEATTSEAQAEAYMKSYINLIHDLSRLLRESAWKHSSTQELYPINVSLKLSSLYSQFDPADADGTGMAVKVRLQEIFRSAKENNAFINIDMEQYCYRDLTVKIFKEILEEREFSGFNGAGLVVQAYLQDSREMVEDLLGWAKNHKKDLSIRLVRGAYWDYEIIQAKQKGWPVPVFTEKWETDANFELLTEILLKNNNLVRTAIGTHNIRSIAHAIALATHLNIPSDRIEFQLLYGMGDPIKKAIVSMDFPLRVYIPFGELIPGMGYLVRRLLENSSNVSFLMQSFSHSLDEDVLLQNPLFHKPNNLKTTMSLHGTEEYENFHRVRKPDADINHGGSGRSPDLPFTEKTQEIRGVEKRDGSKEVPFRNEPDTDFSKAKNREVMVKALKALQADLSKNPFSVPLIIDGEKVYAQEVMESLNPSDPREVIGRVSKGKPEHGEMAIDAASKAFLSWQYTAADERAKYLFMAAELMRKIRYELSALEVLEVGKNWKEADADVAEAIDYLNYYASEMLRLDEPRILQYIPGETNEYLYRPRGVGVVISPWNFPLAILTGMASASIVTGNTVILKPAEQSSVIASKLAEIFLEAGLPRGVINFLPGVGEEAGEYLVQSTRISFIAFTGSREVGIHINTVASQVKEGQDGIKRIIAEMGGKNAIIIDCDTDLDEAVRGTLASAFGYQGEKCSACSRVIIHESIYDLFLNRLVESAKSIKIGNPVDPGVIIGPLIDSDAFQRVSRYIEIGKKEAYLVLETKKEVLPKTGHFIGPTIFADVSPDSTIAQEEIFGPVLAVVRARNFDNSINIANNTKYALTGGLYSRNPEHIKIARERFKVGNLYINRKITGAIVGRQPFGGFKMSGIGSKAGGPDYLLQFMTPVTITENTLRHGFAADGNYKE